MHPLRKLEINLAIITQFPAFKVLLLLKFKQFLSKFLGSALLVIFFHLVFVISVHFDQAEEIFFFFLPNHHHPRINRLKKLEIPLSRKDVLVNNREGFNACDYDFTWHYFEVQ